MTIVRDSLLALGVALGLLLTVTAPGRLAMAAQGVATEGLIAPFIATYNVYARGFPLGEGLVKLSYGPDQRYQMEAELRPTGLASLFIDESFYETVEGSLERGVPQPLRYRQQRTGDRPRQVEMEFDWHSAIVSARRNEHQALISLTPRMVDPLSLHLLLMNDIARGRTKAHYTIIDDTDLETYELSVEGEEQLSTPLGQIRTVRYAQRLPGSERVTYLWFAPRHDHLLVRMVQEKRGKERLRLDIAAVGR